MSSCFWNFNYHPSALRQTLPPCKCSLNHHTRLLSQYFLMLALSSQPCFFPRAPFGLSLLPSSPNQLGTPGPLQHSHSESTFPRTLVSQEFPLVSPCGSASQFSATNICFEFLSCSLLFPRIPCTRLSPDH